MHFDSITVCLERKGGLKKKKLTIIFILAKVICDADDKLVVENNDIIVIAFTCNYALLLECICTLQ